jgi:stress-induced morphogen
MPGRVRQDGSGQSINLHNPSAIIQHPSSSSSSSLFSSVTPVRPGSDEPPVPVHVTHSVPINQHGGPVSVVQQIASSIPTPTTPQRSQQETTLVHHTTTTTNNNNNSSSSSSSSHLFACGICNSKFTQKSNRDRHQRTHDGKVRVSCTYEGCTVTVCDRWALARHMCQHTGKSDHMCTRCTPHKAFGSNAMLKRHIITHERPLVCRSCGNRFANERDLKTHVETEHNTGDVPYRCMECGKVCSSEKSHRMHTQGHANKRHGVSTKRKRTSEGPPSAGGGNIVMRPLAVNPSSSLPSSLSNFNPGNVNKRAKYATNEGFPSTTNAVTTINPNNGNTNFKCNECNKVLSSKGGLKRHMVRHSGESEHRCGICNKAFGGPYLLSRHQIVHTKPFVCRGCSERFATEELLKEHVREAHTGPDSGEWVCMECGKSCSSKVALRKHVVSHSK